MKQIGLFGGTFNPIHFGHLTTIYDLKAQFCLDLVYFIPSAIPPHKPGIPIVAAQDRFEMTQLAIANYSGFEVSEVELKRQGPSYTIETVLHFKKILPKATKLYLIMGIDAFLEIDLWKSFKELFLLIPIIVMTRPSPTSSDTDLQVKKIETFLKNRVDSQYELSDSNLYFKFNKKKSVFIADVISVNISSTQIRTLIKNHKFICNFVPKQVQSFINNRGLYL